VLPCGCGGLLGLGFRWCRCCLSVLVGFVPGLDCCWFVALQYYQMGCCARVGVFGSLNVVAGVSGGLGCRLRVLCLVFGSNALGCLVVVVILLLVGCALCGLIVSWVVVCCLVFGKCCGVGRV